MDPLNEVSTDGGRNMRETCARVLAAALMTGAIAAVVGLSALVGAPTDANPPLAAPRPVPERSVPIHVVPVRSRPHPVRRAETARRVSAPAPRAVVTRPLVLIHTSPAQPPRRHLATTKPKPAPTPAAPTPAATPPAAPTTAVGTPPAPAAQAEDDDKEHHGHAYGHDKEHGNGHEKHED
jgi:hypothetical protein